MSTGRDPLPSEQANVVILPITDRHLDYQVYATRRTAFIMPIKHIYDSRNGGINPSVGFPSMMVSEEDESLMDPKISLVEDLPTVLGGEGGATVVLEITPQPNSDTTVRVSIQQITITSPSIKRLVDRNIIPPPIHQINWQLKLIPAAPFEEYAGIA